MEFDQYVAARYGRLIEHAVLLGCAEGEAGTVVDQVLVAHRRAIAKAEDPDPLVREALERAINGVPERAGRGPSLLGIGLTVLGVVVAIAVAVAVVYRPPPETMPSLFSLDGDQAQRLLEKQGFDVTVRPARACEPKGLVVSSDPPTGKVVPHGSSVTVRTAVPSDVFCEAQYVARSDAWDFVTFALGGPRPVLADQVRLLVWNHDTVTMQGPQVADRANWRRAFDLIERAAHQTVSTTSGMPALRVDVTIPPETTCGLPRPLSVGRRFALRLEIDPRVGRDTSICPLTVDLYRSERVIDTVVVYPRSGV